MDKSAPIDSPGSLVSSEAATVYREISVLQVVRPLARPVAILYKGPVLACRRGRHA